MVEEEIKNKVEDTILKERRTRTTGAPKNKYPCPDGIDPAKWADKSDDHKRAVLNTMNKGGSE